MSLMNAAGGSLTEAVEAAIMEALGEGSTVEVNGGGGHFTIRTVSPAFEGKGLLAKKRLVLRAVAPFSTARAAASWRLSSCRRRTATLLPRPACEASTW